MYISNVVIIFFQHQFIARKLSLVFTLNVPWVPEDFFSFGVIYKIPSHFEGKKNPLVTAVDNLTSMIWNYEHCS